MTPVSAPSIVPTNLPLAALARAESQVNTLILGKARQVRLAFIALLANGHVLIEDLPGLGKTTLAQALSATLGLSFQRIQFTSDLMPADVLGISVYDAPSREFHFHPGPVFTQVLLADEINRAPPRTQSALLEAMAEYQVTTDGKTHPLPPPFFVIATQNPVDLSGTFPLPDSQLDRFLLRFSLGYPDQDLERELLMGESTRERLTQVSPLLNETDILALQKAVQQVHTSPALIDYVLALLDRSRHHPEIEVGLSPRAGLALLRAARAHALMDGRQHVLPDDVQALFVAVAGHRLVSTSDSRTGETLASEILSQVSVD